MKCKKTRCEIARRGGGPTKGQRCAVHRCLWEMNLKTEKDMSFLGQLLNGARKQMFRNWCRADDWNTVNKKAQDEVIRILGSDCDSQIFKDITQGAHIVVNNCTRHTKRHGQRLRLVSKPVGGDSAVADGGTERQRFYVSAKNKLHQYNKRTSSSNCLAQLHFSDHVVLATSWERTDTDTEPRKTGTLNVMSGAYNSLEFVGLRGSLSFMVDQALSDNIEITKNVWHCWANHMINGARGWQAENTSAGKNWDVVGELESLKADARSTSVYIWDVLLDSTLRETISSLEELNKHPDIRIIGKRYALAHGQYRPDLTSFHNGTPDKQQDNLAVFQACVDRPTADNLHTWVAKMLDAILEYKTAPAVLSGMKMVRLSETTITLLHSTPRRVSW